MTTGYWVCYIKEDLKNQLSQININSYDKNLNQNPNNEHIYGSKITGMVNMRVVEDNQKL